MVFRNILFTCLFELLCSQNVVEKDFVHVTYTDAVTLLQKAKKKFEFPVSTLPCNCSPFLLVFACWRGRFDILRKPTLH